MTYVKLFQKAKVETTSGDLDQKRRKGKNWQTKETDTLSNFWNICHFSKILSIRVPTVRQNSNKMQVVGHQK